LNQYLNNLALKINARCAGISYVPHCFSMTSLSQVPTMVIGADVSHPGPGIYAPSFASLVASRDPECCNYNVIILLQSVLKNINFQEAINHFRFANDDKKNPKLRLRRIFFFRDGVSEGEFETIRDSELSTCKKVLTSIYGKDRPHITFIVVGKRHHFRFMPQSTSDSDPSGNCPSGFVVDRGIEHPIYHDFYLQSQPGLKGTSVPAHYTVIEDEILGGNGDQYVYALCHTYQRSTCSVKVPAPVYYADLVCQRAKLHFQPNLSIHIDGIFSGSETEGLEPLIQDFKSLHHNLRETMHFV
ncbi:Piwi domain-containing protein, partial [Lentinula edodes]